MQKAMRTISIYRYGVIFRIYLSEKQGIGTVCLLLVIELFCNYYMYNEK